MQSYLNLPKPLLTFDAKCMKINSLTCNLYCNDECLFFFSMMCVFYFFNNAFGFKNLLLVEKLILFECISMEYFNIHLFIEKYLWYVRIILILLTYIAVCTQMGGTESINPDRFLSTPGELCPVDLLWPSLLCGQ